MPSILSDADKETVKRAVPKASNKILAVAVARLYVARQRWTYTGLQGAAVLCNDTVGNTIWIKLVDISSSSRGVIWDQEIYDTFTYNQDRTFFHSFELEECLAGLSFVDEKEAKKFRQKIEDREKNASKATRAQPFGSNAAGGAVPHETKSHLGKFGSFLHPRSNTPQSPTQPSPQQSPQPPKETEDPAWEGMLAELLEMGITREQIAQNADFIKSYVQQKQVYEAEPARAPPSQAGSRRGPPPAPPPSRRPVPGRPSPPDSPTRTPSPPLPRFRAPPPLADAGRFAGSSGPPLPSRARASSGSAPPPPPRPPKDALEDGHAFRVPPFTERKASAPVLPGRGVPPPPPARTDAPPLPPKTPLGHAVAPAAVPPPPPSRNPAPPLPSVARLIPPSVSGPPPPSTAMSVPPPPPPPPLPVMSPSSSIPAPPPLPVSSPPATSGPPPPPPPPLPAMGSTLPSISAPPPLRCHPPHEQPLEPALYPLPRSTDPISSRQFAPAGGASEKSTRRTSETAVPRPCRELMRARQVMHLGKGQRKEAWPEHWPRC